MRHALTIAGSDSSAGAGIQADIKTFAAHGVYGLSVITAVTAQNTLGVISVEEVSPEMIEHQIEAVFTDIPVHAVKIGMLAGGNVIRAVAGQLARFQPKKVVLDTVLLSKNGFPLLAPDAIDLLVQELFPLAVLVTPNIPEAALLAGFPIRGLSDMEAAAAAIHQKGASHVLVKGGHAEHDPIDVLYDGKNFLRFPGQRIAAVHTHGTGCTLSAAIAANLSLKKTLPTAVENAKAYITGCIAHGLNIGRGAGPLNHFWSRAKA